MAPALQIFGPMFKGSFRKCSFELQWQPERKEKQPHYLAYGATKEKVGALWVQPTQSGTLHGSGNLFGRKVKVFANNDGSLGIYDKGEYVAKEFSGGAEVVLPESGDEVPF